MQISPFASTKSFFKSKPFRSRKQQKPETELTVPSLFTSRNASVDTTNSTAGWTQPIQVIGVPIKQDLIDTYQSVINRSEEQPRKSDDTMREPVMTIPPFQGLPSAQAITPGLLDEEEYRALGLKTPDIQASRNGSRVGSPKRFIEDDDDMLNPGATLHISRERRPDLQVRIPYNTPPARSPRLLDARHGGPTPPSAMSTPSSIPTSRNMKSATTAATPHSIVSPLTGLEMPRPHRPFSTDSLEGATTHNTQTPSRPDPRYPRFEVSRRGSMTSNFEAETPKPGETPVVVNAKALKFDASSMHQASIVPGQTRTKRDKNVAVHGPPPMHRKASAVSIASNINVNKPLPPEPPAGSARLGTSPSPLKHLAYSGNLAPKSQRPSRSNSTSKPQGQDVQHVQRPPLPEPKKSETVNVERRGSQSLGRSITLRSKYTPKDLDSMDEAFQRRTANNSAYQTPVQARSRASPNESQVSLADQNHLHTIVESSPRTSHAMSALDNPMQFSRGPMRMEPSRRPPQPPPQPLRVHTVDIDKAGKKRQPMSRTQSNNSIRTVKSVPESPQRRGSINEYISAERRDAERKNNDPAPNERWASGSSISTSGLSKADRILGMTVPTNIVRPAYEPPIHTAEPRSARSPADDSDDEAFYEIRGKQDAHFLEIKDRLRLLSAKEDPMTTFDSLREENTSTRDFAATKTSFTDKGLKDAKPTIEEKLHLTGTLQDNPIVPAFIAELDAQQSPSPVELQGSETIGAPLSVVIEEPRQDVAELGVPSPDALPSVSAPNGTLGQDQAHRRGREDGSNPISTASAKTKSQASARSVRARSLASIAASDIPDFYTNSPTPNTHSKRPSTAGSEYEEVLTAQAAEQVLLHILASLDNLEDLFAAALVSKGFYRTFKKHELYLLKHAIWKMSPAAWELREMSIPYSELEPGTKDYTPALYFRYYVQDLLTMVELKAMILESCKSFLRPETIQGLAGETERSPMIDEAFWRVWTFCRVFGCGMKREEDIVGQMDWLRGGILANQSSDTRTLALTDELARNSVLFNPPAGFAKGNSKNGLSADELYDMIEIWTCLGVLVRGYHGKRQEARDYGVYDRCNVNVGDVVSENAMLEEWTHHLLTLAPSAVLDVTSPATPTRTQFAQARSQGYTKWMPPKKGMSRSTFLKEPVSRVYEEVMSKNRPAQLKLQPFSSLPSVHPSIGPDAAIAAKARIARHAAEIRKQKEDPSYRNVPVSDDRPLSNYSDVLDRLEAISAATDAPPMPKLPGLAARLSRAKFRGLSGSQDGVSLRPTSPTSTIQSSAAPSVQNSFSTNGENASVADLSSSMDAKPGKKFKHPFQKKSAETSIGGSPSKGGPGRFSSLRGHKILEKSKSKRVKNTSKTPSSEEVSAAPMPPSDEKFAIVLEEDFSSSSRPPQVRDPVDLAVEKLVGMGYEEKSAKKVLAQTETGNGINLEAALVRLKKENERKKRLERLETMG